MSESRVEIVGAKPFVPREWLRRELLWASFVAPYAAQITGWLRGSARSQHTGNVTRRNKFSSLGKDLDYQSNAFFNQGKNVAGLLNTLVLFKTIAAGMTEGHSAELLELHALVIDKALGSLGSANLVRPKIEQESLVYRQCTSVIEAVTASDDQRTNNKRLRWAGKLMSDKLAIDELYDWVKASQQSEQGTLDNLVISDGGVTRSGAEDGSTMIALQAAFSQMVETDAYQSLNL